MLSAHIFNGAEVLITASQIVVIQIQIGFLCHRHIAVSQNSAEGVDVHTVHQTAFGEIIPQSMGRIFLLDTRSSQIPLEIGFKGVHLKGHTRFTGKEIVSGGIPVFESHPPLEAPGSRHGEEYEPGLSALGIFRR